MQEAVPVGAGGMAVIMGLDDDAVRAACAAASEPGDIVEAVNFNAPLQVVIAGHAAAVGRACEKARQAGAKRALPLPVSAPFHSSLLAPAGARLRAALADVALRSPAVSLVNNVDVAVETEPARIVDALVRQASSPVRWVEVVQRLRALGVDTLIEFGPGKVLAGLAPRIDKSLRVFSVSDPDTLQAALTAISAPGASS
jgi:[acyl-carrier-protein] S-malonyltransferase